MTDPAVTMMRSRAREFRKEAREYRRLAAKTGDAVYEVRADQAQKEGDDLADRVERMLRVRVAA